MKRRNDYIRFDKSTMPDEISTFIEGARMADAQHLLSPLWVSGGSKALPHAKFGVRVDKDSSPHSHTWG